MMQQNDETVPIDLAGEYVLGTLQGSERDEFKQHLAEDHALQEEVTAWENRLAPLLDTVEPVTPPANNWSSIQQRIAPQSLEKRGGLWNSLIFWRSLGMVTAGLVLVLGLSLVGLRQENIGIDRLMVVLNDQSQAGWIVGTQGTGPVMRVSAVQPTQLPAGKVCQLWMETEDSQVIPIGVLPHTGSIEMDLPAKMQRESRFKVSIESALYAPVRSPSEEIVFQGKMTRI